MYDDVVHVVAYKLANIVAWSLYCGHFILAMIDRLQFYSATGASSSEHNKEVTNDHYGL